MLKMHRSILLMGFLIVAGFSLVVPGRTTSSSSETIERKLGIGVGDWATYNFTVWNSSEVRTDWVWFNITVTDIYPPHMLTYDILKTLKNGTELHTSGVASVLGSYEWYPSDLEIGFFISADLNAGDPVYEYGAYPPWGYAVINETVVFDFPSGTRDVNHLNITYTYGPGFILNLYWDRATGIPIKSVSQQLDGKQRGEYEILETNIAGLASEFSQLDTTPPVVSILSPENKTYTVNDIPLTVTVSEATSWISYSLDGQTNVSITGNTTLSGLSNGLHSLIVYANDTAGNTGASETIYFSVKTAEFFPLPLEWLIIAVIVVVVIAGTTGFIIYRRRKASVKPSSSSTTYLFH